MPARKRIGIRVLKNELSRVLSEIAEDGGEYVVTDRDQPKAVLRPWREEDRREDRVARSAEVIERIREMAREVAAAATSGQSAADVVSEQRR